jgi:cyclic pyranopterin phosphate synthase
MSDKPFLKKGALCVYDRFNRHIHYLRISVTDRCNLRCEYCNTGCDVPFIPHEDMLSFEEICDVVKTAVGMGFDKFRITGGEPLMRREVHKLIAMIAATDGVKDIGLTTNGMLLPRDAPLLAEAGLKRINISLDSLDPAEYKRITGNGNLQDVLDGIKAAQDVGFDPIKINCVIDRSPNEPRAQEVGAFAKENGFQVRFIHRMDTEQGEFHPVHGGMGGICNVCNRLRLTCTGKVLPCLFSDTSFDVRELGAEEALRRAIDIKPEKGISSHNHFRRTGG